MRDLRDSRCDRTGQAVECRPACPARSSWDRTVRLLISMLLTLPSLGCVIEPFLPSLPVQLSARPNHVCAGDPVVVSWDLGLPSHESFCEYPTGGYDGRVSCDVDSDCPEGGRCYDGMCCASPIPLSECGASCPPDSMAILTFDPATGASPATSTAGSGRTTFSPSATTSITLSGEWGPPTTPTGTATDRVVVVDAPPLENLVMGFAFHCAGDQASWSDFELDSANIYPSSRVGVSLVRNTSGRQISVSNGVLRAVTLDAGASTTELNGRLEGTRWSASLTVLGMGALPPLRCDPTDLTAPGWPSLSIEVRLTCEPDEG